MYRSVAIAALACAGVATVPYLLGLGPAFYWLDSAEFVAAAWDLGNAHPPGHPLAALVHRLFCYLPAGSISFRVGLASALMTTSAVVVLYLISVELLAALGSRTLDSASESDPRSAAGHLLAAAFGALSPAFSYALWFNAVRAEVYALNLLLLTLGIYFLLRGRRKGDGRHMLAAAFAFGLALCNHHLLALLALPGALLLWPVRAAWRSRGERRALLVAPVTIAVALLLLAYLPLRSQNAPRVNWGAPHTVQRFLWVVSAKAFQRKSAERAAQETVGKRGIGVAYALMGGPPDALAPALVGGLVLFLGLYGLILLARSRQLWLAAGLALLLLMNLLGPMLVGFDPYNPDAFGYLALAAALLGPLSAVALLTFAQAVAGRRTYVLTGLLAMSLAAPAARAALNYPRVDLHAQWAADQMAREVLALPPGALLLSSYFQTIFGLWALQSSEDARPDVRLVHRGFAAQPGYLAQIARRQPELGQLVRDWARTGNLEGDALQMVAESRYVGLEYDLNISRSLNEELLPYGLTLRFAPGRSPSPREVRADERRVRDALTRIGKATDMETRRALVWRHYLLAYFSCTRKLFSLATYHIEAALQLAPISRHLSDLRRQCFDGIPRRGAR